MKGYSHVQALSGSPQYLVSHLSHFWPTTLEKHVHTPASLHCLSADPSSLHKHSSHPSGANKITSIISQIIMVASKKSIHLPEIHVLVMDCYVKYLKKMKIMIYLKGRCQKFINCRENWESSKKISKLGVKFLIKGIQTIFEKNVMKIFSVIWFG